MKSDVTSIEVDSRLSFMSVSSIRQGLSNLAKLVALLIVLWAIGYAQGKTHAAQQQIPWTPQQTIPGFHPNTLPPVLLADQNRTVHTISSQRIETDTSQPVLAITYNQWSMDSGWTEPIDVLLPPIKQEARILDGFLDESGIIHIAFFGGDDYEANTYYSRAIAAAANRADAWSEPALVGSRAITPEDGVMAGDDKGNLVIIYSGDLIGRGLYATYSFDRGANWSEPTPIYLAYRNDFTPIYIDIYQRQSGWFHTVWSVNDIGNLGTAIYYSRFNFADLQWSEPLTLAETKGGLGTQVPVIVEHQDSLIVMYYDAVDGRQHFIQSYDGWQTWTDPVPPFQHVGLNGAGDLVVDSDGTLHYFWGQRITSSPDIHGMWHSVLVNNIWSEPEAVVSGPSVDDQTSNKAFDPYDARAVVNQGNSILVTWRSDPGLKGNGVWYSFAKTNSPELPLATLIASPPEFSSRIPISENPNMVEPAPENQFVPVEENLQVYSDIDQGIGVQSNTISLLVIALIPVLLLSFIVVVWNQRRAR